MSDTAPLPIDSALADLGSALAVHRAAVLAAPTGSGKSTRVPPYLARRHQDRVIVAQPRRVAAWQIARRIADESGTRIGEFAGYAVRFDRRAGPETRVLVVTYGVLKQMLQRDPFLESTSALVLDEVHERSVEMDLCLGMLRECRAEARPDLEVVAMSATIDLAFFKRQLGDAGVVESGGRTYPVEVVHTGTEPLARVVRRAFSETSGDVLVFLAGVPEIRRAWRSICERGFEAQGARTAFGGALHALYGTQSRAAQSRVFEGGGERKVILATNVAESSLTVPGVTAVVDTGLAKFLRYDVGCALNRLEVGPISHSSAAQRAGRAGRTRPGTCYRMWSDADDRNRRQFDPPEIEALDPSGALVEVLRWGARLDTFPWPTQPPAKRAESALKTLRMLEVTDESDRLTPIGRRVAELPVHPRLGRFLLAGRDAGVAPEAAAVAAWLSDRDPFRGDAWRRSHTGCDVGDRLDAQARMRDSNDATRSQRQLLRLLATDEPTARQGDARVRSDADTLGRLQDAALAAFADRVCMRRGVGDDRGVMVGGRGVRLPRETGVHSASFWIALSVEAGRRGEYSEAWVRLAMEVDDARILARSTTHTVARYDVSTDRIVARGDHPLRRPDDCGERCAATESRCRPPDVAGDALDGTGVPGRPRVGASALTCATYHVRKSSWVRRLPEHGTECHRGTHRRPRASEHLTLGPTKVYRSDGCRRVELGRALGP